MTKHGGPRPNSGRPKGSKENRTQELVRKATDGGLMPLEVLISGMRFFNELSENKIHEYKALSDPDEKEDSFKKAVSFKSLAKEYARDAAPYIHPKLSSVDAKVQISNQETALAELE